MKTVLIVVGLCLAVLTACMATALIQTRHQAKATLVQSAEFRRQVEELSAQVTALTADKARLEERVETESATAKNLQVQLEQQAAAEPPPPAPIQPPKPFRVRTYLGREPLGEAWLVPSNFAQDPETGRASYEPVIMLDDKLRQKFTVYETNYVPQPVSTTVNYNYTPPRTYYYPVYYPVRGHRRPPRPEPDQQPMRPTFPTLRAVGNSSGGSPWGSVFVPPRANELRN